MKNLAQPERGHGEPLRTILEEHKPDKVCLLYTPDMASNLDAVMPHISQLAPCETFCAEKISDPSDMKSVYAFSEHFLSAHRRKNGSANLLYNLSSGTPTMHATLLLLGAVQYPGKLLRAPDPQHKPARPVLEVRLPFALALNTLPAPSSEPPFIAGVNARIFDQVRRKVGASKASVLILGETGVGKSALARYIHAHSVCAGRDMVSLNCAEIAGDHTHMRSELFGHEKGAFTGADSECKGAFERADGSTLFLDELGEIPLPMQSMLLKVIEDGEVRRMGGKQSIKMDVRIIAATNRNLLEEVKAGRFREDLYYRLAKYTPTLRPVREYTPDEVKTLLKRFMDDKTTLLPEAEAWLLAYGWPGNIREMKYRLESICLLADDVVTLADVEEQLGPPKVDPLVLSDGFSLEAELESIQRRYVQLALQKTEDNTSKAARLLGVKDSTLRDWRKRLNI